jgi:hypothetical protein
MAVEFKKTDISNDDLRLAILKETLGCSHEREKVLAYDLNYDVILHAKALAKRILGLDGVDIGTDPTSNFSPRNHDEDRRRIREKFEAICARTNDEKTLEHAAKIAEGELNEVEWDEERAARLASAFDAEAWQAVKELEDRIMRLAAQMEAVGLVVCNPDHLAPQEFQEQEANAGRDGKVPLTGAIMGTDLGKRFITSNARLRPVRSLTDKILRKLGVRRGPPTHPWDEPVVIEW